jgi:hypothetical protein
MGIIAKDLPESQPELKDGFAGQTQEHSDAQDRVGHFIPWKIHLDSI